MPVTIRNDAREVLFHSDENFENVQAPPSHTMQEYIHRMDFDFGKARFREISFDGFLIGYGDVQVHQRLHVEAKEPMHRVGTHFMLQGEVTASIAGVINNLKTSSHQYNMMYTPDLDESLLVEQQPKMKVFGLSFSGEKFIELAMANNGPVLDKFAEKVENRRPVYFDRGLYITPRMMKVIEEVHTCHFKGGLKKLFLQSKAIELLALQCEQVELEERGSYKPSKVSRTDEERIYHARDLLIASSHEPPSLNELARRAGLNEFKLKVGFKKVFDNTVFGYLSDYRLDQAREMVYMGEKSFTEIADQLGYSSIQHFSSAFRKKFGVSPREVKRRG
jgi:AraC-like DNA-binding protein